MPKLEHWKKQVLSNSAMGLGASFILVFLNLFRVVILGRELEIEEYGDVIIALNFFQIILLFLRPGISDLLYRFLSDSEQKKSNEFASSLITFSLYLSLACAFVIGGLILGIGKWLAASFYETREIYVLLVVLLPVYLIDQFSESGSTLLRIRDKFAFVVFPPVLGTFLSLCWIWHAKSSGTLNAYHAVMAIGAGQLFASVFIQFTAILIERKSFVLNRRVLTLRPLRGHGSTLRSCLYQTSLIRYLKASSDQGGIFLLGIIGTATQVAVFGMAFQMTRPIGLLLSAVGNAVGPEVHRMVRREEWTRLAGLCRSFVVYGTPVVIISGILAYWVGPIIIGQLLKPAYLDSVNVFVVLLVSYGSMIVFIPFFPAAVALDRLKWRNVIVGLRSVYLLIAFCIWPTAMAFAIVLLLGSLTTRIFNDRPLYNKIKTGKI